MKKSGRRRAAGLLAALVLSWLPIEVEARSAAQDDRQGQIEALSRVLGMTTAEIEAMGLSSEEMQFLLEGYTEETVVVGTRAPPRTVAESPVPVDVLSSSDITRQGTVNLQDQLRTIVPSFNVNTQPMSDASTVVRPAMLRNLALDDTLVLINGKRRHRSSIIDWHGGNGVAFGSQGPDISAIPSIALRQVEVLRDGAASQYGSDAVAGVMNFRLKDAPSGGTLTFNTGTFGSGDGEAFNVAGNVGLPLGTTGFANLSLEYGSSNPTNRSAPRSDAIALRAAGNLDIASDTPQVWGSPRVDDDLKLFGNFGYTAANGVQFYSHTNYASKKVTGGFFFRNPNTRGGVFSIDGGKTLLIGDALMAAGTGSANCPTVAITDHVADAAALEQVFDDPNCFSFRERFPGGFTPNFGGKATDVSLVGGVRGTTAAGFVWNVSGSVGAHETDLFISETVNASLGPDTPTACSMPKVLMVWSARSASARDDRRWSAMPGCVALLRLGPNLLHGLVANAAFQTFLNRFLRGTDLRVLFLVAADQVAEVFAVVAIFAARDLRPDPLLLPIRHGDAHLDQRHLSECLCRLSIVR